MSFSEFAVVTGIAELDSVIMYLIVALIICGINSILIPIVQWSINKIKSYVKKFQKTPEKDGEISDNILDKINQIENKFITSLKNTENNLQKLYDNNEKHIDQIDHFLGEQILEQNKVINNLKQDNGIMSASIAKLTVENANQKNITSVPEIDVNKTVIETDKDNNIEKVLETQTKSNLFGGEQ